VKSTGKLRLHAEIERWPLVEPFRITGYTWEVAELVLVVLEWNGHVGQGEAAGVYYKGETAASMIRQIEAVRTQIEAGITRQALQSLLPRGGARNAVDCALWDLEAKLTGRPVWQLAALDPPRSLRATFTCGADTPERMAAAARSYPNIDCIKLKLTGDPVDAERVLATRRARPDVWLSVDANQGFTRAKLQGLMPILVQSRVSLIEQPFPVGQEALLDGLSSPILIAADESVQGTDDLEGVVGRVGVVNIKLDKCGGLTEALAMAHAARNLGLESMVGNMMGTSLAMAPGFILGQLCGIIDLDGPIALKLDRAVPVRYSNGLMTCPEALWGFPPIHS
jgi:L-Ala-D/L-Glu epimerase